MDEVGVKMGALDPFHKEGSWFQEEARVGRGQLSVTRKGQTKLDSPSITLYVALLPPSQG